LLITSESINQSARKALFTCVVYSNDVYKVISCLHDFGLFAPNLFGITLLSYTNLVIEGNVVLEATPHEMTGVQFVVVAFEGLVYPTTRRVN